MVEKAAAAFATVLAVVLGIWARMSFVRRSEIYQKDGRPVYRHASDCVDLQRSCGRLICQKITEVKATQAGAEQDLALALAGIHDELKSIRQFMGGVEQYMKDHQ